ncbi:hypothetical protein MARPO_0054s0121 [Marchantia polymorpha]|uniref:Uncharacterized protein n=1 Tax=Marchantia polymorpha TaxID=3197 RepID=A0A2R6WVZ3_MARPO|nr:hypothetical protein MARPO_0054s0121 [Marchantia polymorpha]|eukprot:PTQ38020.1 hypothetical protein MARPO_0054s0121 [Marchantia polymorpha]
MRECGFLQASRAAILSASFAFSPFSKALSPTKSINENRFFMISTTLVQFRETRAMFNASSLRVICILNSARCSHHLPHPSTACCFRMSMWGQHVQAHRRQTLLASSATD